MGIYIKNKKKLKMWSAHIVISKSTSLKKLKGKFWCKNHFRLNHDLDKYKHFCSILTVRQLFIS